MPRHDPQPLHAPATARNRGPLGDVLRGVLPRQGLVLEIASGTGEHAVHFAERFPSLTWQPSDVDPESLASIEAHAAMARLPNLLATLTLDVLADDWPPLSSSVAVMVCINMIHIAPWEATVGLFRHAAKLLSPGRLLFLYGPFIRAGVPTAASNVAFDASLRRRDPRFGVRCLEDVVDVATASGFRPGPVFDMPANNLSVAFYRQD